MSTPGSGGIRAVKVNPNYLHSNSTSHPWIFGAFAELIDNAYDAKAKEIHVDHVIVEGSRCLSFQDDGVGMDQDHLYRMMSFGFSDSCQRNHIGMYGNGFKSGSMRIGKDAIVFTRTKESAGIGLLSQTYLEFIKAETVIVPMLHYSVPGLAPIDDGDHDSSLAAILQHSLFTDVEELLTNLRKLQGTGTLIIIYNLQKVAKFDRMELEFIKDPHDIRCLESYEEENVDLPNYRNSLREYCKILFLKPNMKIKIRGEYVKTKLVDKSLRHSQIDEYKPKGEFNGIQITFGMLPDSETARDFGMMLYQNNRLIKAYEKLACQKQNDGIGRGVVGVTEAKFLTPTHIKQDFIRDDKFNAAMYSFNVKLRNYWNDRQNDISSSPSADTDWVQCEKKDCQKWRRLPQGFDLTAIKDKNWYCYMHPNNIDCNFPEDVHDADEELKRAPRKKRTVSKRKSDDGTSELDDRPSKQRKNSSPPNSDKILLNFKGQGNDRTECVAGPSSSSSFSPPVLQATVMIPHLPQTQKSPGTADGRSGRGTDEQLSRGRTNEQQSQGTDGQPSRGTTERQSSRETDGQPSRGTTERQSSRETDGQPSWGMTDGQSSQGTDGQPSQGTDGQLSQGTDGQPSQGADGQLIHGILDRRPSAPNELPGPENETVSPGGRSRYTMDLGRKELYRQAEALTQCTYQTDDGSSSSRGKTTATSSQITHKPVRVKVENETSYGTDNLNSQASVSFNYNNNFNTTHQNQENLFPNIKEESADEISQMIDRIVEEEDNIVEIRARLDDEKSKAITEMKSRLERKGRELSEMRENLANKEREMVEKERELANKERELSEMKNKVDEEKQEKEDIKSKLGAVRIRLGETERQRDGIKEQFGSFKQQCRRLLALLAPNVSLGHDVNIEQLVSEMVREGSSG